MDDYYAYAEPSYQHSADWGWSNRSYASYFEEFKTWIKNRVKYIEDNLTVPTDIGEIVSPDLDDNVQNDNGIKVYSRNGVLCVESTIEATLKIYRIDGSVAGEIAVEIGENIYPLAPRGMIIINGQRLYLKPI